MKVKIVGGNILDDIPQKKLGDLIEIVMEKGLESLDETLKKLDILAFYDYSGEHESRYLELRDLTSL